MKSPAFLPRAVLLASLALLGHGCAYYNTFFHARQAYNQAEKARAEAPRENQESIGLDLYEQAMKKCAKVIVEYPDSRWVDDAILLMGKCFYARGDYLAAFRKFDEILLYYEKSDLASEARFWKAKTLVELDRYDEAVPSLQKFREGKKNDLRGEALYLLAVVEYERENYGAAAEGLELYLDQDKEARGNDDVLRLLGDCYRKTGERAKALSVYQERLQDPLLETSARLEASLDRADILAEEGRFEDAYGTLDDLLSEMSSREDSLRIDLHRGKAYLAEGRTDEAVDLFRSSLALASSSPAGGEIAFLLGDLYLNEFDNKDSAASAFRTAAAAPGDEAQKAEASAKAVQLGEYIDLRKAFAAGEADSARAHFLLAEHDLFFFDEPESALARYRFVSEGFPESEYAPSALAAEAYLSGKEEGGAARSDSLLRVLVRGYPKSPPAREVLDRNAIEVEPESLAAWVALWEEAHPEADSATLPDSAGADGESSEMFAFTDGSEGPLEGPPAPLRLSKRAEPTYPLLPLGDRPRPATAEVEVEVSEEGKIVDARIVRSSEEIFEGPALAAAYQCRYFPETNAGPRTANLMFEFRSGPR